MYFGDRTASEPGRQSSQPHSLPSTATFFLTLYRVASTMLTPPANPTPSSSSTFQVIFSAAVKAYEKRTKKDLLLHPLASQLQACDTAASILTVLQGQVNDLDKGRNSNERLTKWLNPTVNVLLTFSTTISGGVSLVSIKFCRWGLRFYSNYAGFFTGNSDIRRRWCPPPGWYIVHVSLQAILTSKLVRRLRMSTRRKRP